MSHLVALSVMLGICPSETPAKPTLEWTLLYMVREIPAGSKKESTEDFLNYDEHRKEYKEGAKITIYTPGFADAMAKASTPLGLLIFGVVATKDDKVKIYGGFEREQVPFYAPSVASTEDCTEIETSYGKEMKLASSGGARPDPDRPGHVLKGKVGTWVLIVKKADADIQTLTRKITDRPRPARLPLRGANNEDLPLPKPRPQEKK